jgi:hypothetical protein
MTKGKNFSCNNASGKRKKSDLYETPYCLTRELLDRITFTGTILEPACGNGAIVKILEEKGYTPTYYDIEKDFFTETEYYDTIISNPPFSLAHEFIQKAKTVCRRFIFLLPLSYLHGKKRYDEVWTDKLFPLSQIWVFSRYPMLGEPLREDGKVNTGMVTYMFAEWTKFYTGKPVINWIDINKYILKKGE